MQIQAIKVTNMIGSRRADVRLDTPVTLFCGPNGASKSSIQESVRMAFTGKTLRVNLKKEYPLLVSDGAKTGKAVVVTDIGTASFELPSGTHTLEGDLKLGLPDALEYVLNAQAFASIPLEARRTFLFALTNCNVTTKEVKRRLLEKDCDEAKADLVLPMLKSGFPAACDLAKSKGTEAKGAWQQVTGEKFGSKKGADWEAVKPEVDADAMAAAMAALAEAEAKVSAQQEALGAINQQLKTQREQQQQSDEAQAKVATLPRLLVKLATDEASLADCEKIAAELTAKAGTGKKIGLLHDLARFLNSVNFGDEGDPGALELIERYEAEHGPIDGAGDPEAAADLPARQRSLTMLQNAVANDKRDIASAEAARALLATFAKLDRVNDEAVEQMRAELQATIATKNIAANAAHVFEVHVEQAASADGQTEKAAQHFAEVSQWAAIADSLAPDGIPAEMLAQALKPINTAMKDSSSNTGWRQPTINTDMSITADTRPYNLLSKSEKWRVDAMIAVAIAQLSEVQILMLDEVDILEPAARGELLYWMDDLASAGALNTVLLFATMKQAPTGLPESIRAIWLENGVIHEHEEIAEAA